MNDNYKQNKKMFITDDANIICVHREHAGHTVKAQRDNRGSRRRGYSQYADMEKGNETNKTYMETQTNVVKGIIPNIRRRKGRLKTLKEIR